MSLSHKRQTREIITKAICGKGRKFSTATHTVTPPHHPTSILGLGLSTTSTKRLPPGTESK